jgi:hypothetical protein
MSVDAQLMTLHGGLFQFSTQADVLGAMRSVAIESVCVGIAGDLVLSCTGIELPVPVTPEVDGQSVSIRPHVMALACVGTLYPPE